MHCLDKTNINYIKFIKYFTYEGVFPNVIQTQMMYCMEMLNPCLIKAPPLGRNEI